MLNFRWHCKLVTADALNLDNILNCVLLTPKSRRYCKYCTFKSSTRHGIVKFESLLSNSRRYCIILDFDEGHSFLAQTRSA
jgi:hypothetical protein